LNRFFLPSIDYVLAGKHLCGYWYIPFMMMQFAISPAFIAYMKMKRRPRLFVMRMSLLVTSLAHRPVANLAVIQSAMFFTPVYLLGINVDSPTASLVPHSPARTRRTHQTTDR
jgi:hypothetical protein